MANNEILKMDIILYKIGKFQQDLEIFFEDLNVVGYLEDPEDFFDETLNGKNVYKTGSDIQYLKDKLIIICSFEHEEPANKLQMQGFICNQNYITGIDFIKKLDKENKYIIWGTGEASQRFIQKYPDLNILYYVDNDEKKQGKHFFGKLVHTPERLLNEDKNKVILIIAINSAYVLTEQLGQLGFDNAYHLYNEYKPVSYCLEKTIRDKPITNFICPEVFNENMIIDFKGNIRICASGSIDFYSGNMTWQSDSLDYSINSLYAKLIRLSILNGTYSFCTRCYYLFPSEHSVVGDFSYNKSTYSNYKAKIPEDMPFKTVRLSYDTACNLRCPSCREENQVDILYERHIIDAMHQRVVNEIVPKTERLWVAGNGEVFYSKNYREIIFEKFKGEELVLQTNGLLFNQKNWNKLENKYKYLEALVSVDAACEQTYKKLRGADFNILLENLRFISELRKCNKVNVYKLCFVIQQENFNEMINFIHIGQQLGVDYFIFYKLNNWRNIPEDEFIEMDIYDNRNPNHEKFLQLIEDPIFTHPSIEVHPKDHFGVAKC